MVVQPHGFVSDLVRKQGDTVRKPGDTFSRGAAHIIQPAIISINIESCHFLSPRNFNKLLQQSEEEIRCVFDDI